MLASVFISEVRDYIKYFNTTMRSDISSLIHPDNEKYGFYNVLYNENDRTIDLQMSCDAESVEIDPDYTEEEKEHIINEESPKELNDILNLIQKCIEDHQDGILRFPTGKWHNDYVEVTDFRTYWGQLTLDYEIKA